VIGVVGRGFPGASKPVARVIVQSTAAVPPSSSISRQEWPLGAPVLQPVGDLLWELRGRLPWTSHEHLQTLKVRVAGVGSCKLAMDAKGVHEAQEWRPIGDPADDLQIMLVLKELPTEDAAKERSQRQLRIQRRQLELDMLRRLPAQKIFAWEEKKQQKSATIIQRFWRLCKGSSSSSPAFRAEAQQHSEQTRSSDEKIKNHLHHQSRQEEDVGNDDDNDDDLVEEADLKRFTHLYDWLTKIAHDRMAEEGVRRFSTHEQYQSILELRKTLDQEWPDFCAQQARSLKYRKEVSRLMKQLSQLSASLSKTGIPLRSQVEQEISWPLSTKDGVQRKAHEQHQARMEHLGVGKEWWRVRCGNEERDIRRISPCVTSNLKDERNNARWWISFASKHSMSTKDIQAKAKPVISKKEVCEDVIERESERIVNEFRQKFSAREDPKLAAILQCPPHRLQKLQERLQGGSNRNNIQKNGQTLGKKGNSEHRDDEGVAENQESDLSRKKRKKRKEEAMKNHIEALEEQVAVLRARMAQAELEKLQR